MGSMTNGIVLTVAAIFSTSAGAAGPSETGGASGTARDIRSQKNDRLHKCAAMSGDERATCQADAKAMAKAATGQAASKRASERASSASSK